MQGVCHLSADRGLADAQITGKQVQNALPAGWPLPGGVSRIGPRCWVSVSILISASSHLKLTQVQGVTYLIEDRPLRCWGMDLVLSQFLARDGFHDVKHRLAPPR